MGSDELNIPLDPRGDVYLLISCGGKQKRVQASSKVMSLASPVWCTMLDPQGPFRESDPKNGEISFLHDHAEALLFLLLAAHLKYAEIPEEVTFKLLLDICIVCDKYDSIEIVHPWLSKWRKPLEHLVEKNGYEEFLFIAWALGDQKTFERICLKLVLESSTNDRNECLNASGEIQSNNLPPAVVGQSCYPHPIIISSILTTHANEKKASLKPDSRPLQAW